LLLNAKNSKPPSQGIEAGSGKETEKLIPITEERFFEGCIATREKRHHQGRKLRLANWVRGNHAVAV
jgi:hypothetical protein